MSALGSLKSPVVRRLALASCAGASARGVFLGALPLAVAKNGGGPFTIGLASASLTVWWLFAVPLSEVLDRMGIGPALRVVAGLRVLALLPLMAGGLLHGTTAIVWLISGGLVYGFFDSMASTADRSLPALLVASSQQDDAFSLLSAVNGVAIFVIGPSVGAVLLATARWLPFALAGVSFVFSYFMYFPFFSDPRAEKKIPEKAEGMQWYVSALAGIRHFGADRALKSIVATLLGVVIAEELVVVTLPPYFEHGSGIADWVIVLGSLRTAAGAVAIASAMLASTLARRLGRWRVLCLVALGGSLGPAIMAVSPRWPLVLTALIIASVAESIWVPLVQSETAMRTPPELMARTRAGMMFLTWGTLPIVSVVGGTAAQALGIRPILISGSCIAVLCSFLGVWRLFRRASAEDRRQDTSRPISEAEIGLSE